MLVGLAKLPALESALPGPEQISPKITRRNLVDKRGRHLRSVAVVVLVGCGVVYARGQEGEEESEVVGRLSSGRGEAKRCAFVAATDCGTTRSVLGTACSPCRHGCVCMSVLCKYYQGLCIVMMPDRQQTR